MENVKNIVIKSCGENILAGIDEAAFIILTHDYTLPLYSQTEAVITDSLYGYTHAENKENIRSLQGFIDREHFPSPESKELSPDQFGQIGNVIVGIDNSMPKDHIMHIFWATGPRGEKSEELSIILSQ